MKKKKKLSGSYCLKYMSGGILNVLQ